MTIKKEKINNSDNILIVLAKNPVLGKAKTRIAKGVGDAKALSIYIELLEVVKTLTKQVNCDVAIYYSEYIDTLDNWSETAKKYLQKTSPDLGERIFHALDEQLNSYTSAIIIGSDCPYLTKRHISQAFDLLQTNDVVLGPSNDGGFYLMGINEMNQAIFKDVEWSTDSVASTILQNAERLDYSVATLESLTDIDEIEDWEAYQRSISDVHV